MTAHESPHTAGCRGTVLLVEDEAPLRHIQRRMLEQDGYAVLEAADGAEGIRAADGDVMIDVIIADLHMPVLSGEQMVRTIRGARPSIPVLYVTGRIDRLMDARPLDDAEAFLEKPFTAAGLQEAVSLLLYGTIGKRRTVGTTSNVSEASDSAVQAPASIPA
jgi:two-component system, cell cycle sensor histidine kinase and response regulator CckA